MAKMRNIYLTCTIFFMVEINIKISGIYNPLLDHHGTSRSSYSAGSIPSSLRFAGYRRGYRSLYHTYVGYSNYGSDNSQSGEEDLTYELPLLYFTCGKTRKFFNASQFCDGKYDCDDGTDEQDCEKEVTLYYYIYMTGRNHVRQESFSSVLSRATPSWMCRGYYHAELAGSYRRYRCAVRGEEFLDLVSLDLSTNKEYYVNVLNTSWEGSMTESWRNNVSPTKNIWMTTQGLRADIYFTSNSTTSNVTENYLMRGGKDGFPNGVVRRGNQDSFRNPVMDWSTSYVFAIVNSEIKFCDENITTCYSFIKSKFARDPLLIAISVKQRLLFWTIKITNNQFYLLKYNLSTRNGSTTVLNKDLKSPRALTVDAFRDRVHWLEQGDEDLVIHSTSFDGSETKITNAVTGSLVKDIASFAVFNNTVYWTDKVNRILWKCSLNNNCTQLTRRSQIPKKHTIMDSNVFELGPLMIDHSLMLTNMTNLKKVCEATACSHMCYPYSETAFDCYCSDGLPTANKTFCDGRTLIVTYRNLLFTVGFLDLTTPPIIRRYTLSITNISAVAYNSIEDRVILTEVGQQNIYSWTPKTRELKLILAGGPGTISKIEFDDSSNNLYWIDPTNSTLRLMNMKSRLTANLVTGNSSYILSDFTLSVKLGQMFLLFVKNNSSTVMERLWMNGALDSRTTIFEDSEAGDIDHLSVHNNADSAYENRQLYLLDKQTNELKFITSGAPRTVKVSTGGTLGKIQTITFIDDTVVWTSEDDRVIRRAKINVDFMFTGYWFDDSSSLERNNNRTLMHDAMQSILLGDLKINENGPGFLRIASVTNIDATASRDHLHSCLENNGGCDELCVRGPLYGWLLARRYTCLCTEDKILTDRTSCVAASKAQTTTRRQQPAEISEITASTYTTVESATESFAKSRNGRSDSTSTSFMFLTILGILAGFALGYFREDLLLKFNSLRSHISNNYPSVRLSRTRHESTNSLCANKD